VLRNDPRYQQRFRELLARVGLDDAAVKRRKARIREGIASNTGERTS
jgi:hypothetical protein